MKREKIVGFLKKKWVSCLWLLGLFFCLCMELSNFNPEPIVKFNHTVMPIQVVPLVPENTISQNINCEEDIIEGIDIRYSVTSAAVNADNVVVTVYDDEGVKRGEWLTKVEYIKTHNVGNYFLDKPLNNMKGKAIKVVIGIQSEQPSTGVNIWCNGVPSLGENVYAPKNSEYYCIRIVRCIVSPIVIKIVVCVIALFMLVLSIFLGIKKEWRDERKYIILGSVVSVIFLVCVLPYRCPDEQTHFQRIYEIAEGHLVSEASEINGNTRIMPDNIKSVLPLDFKLSDFISDINRSLDYDNPVEYHFSTASLYSPISYLFQSIGVAITRLLTNNLYLIAEGGKLFGLLGSLFLLYFAIKLIPIKKKLLIAIAFCPLFLQQSVSLSADSFTNAICIFALSYAIYLAYGKDEGLSKKHIVIAFLVVIALALCKIVYLPLCFLFMMVPQNKFSTKKRYYGFQLSLYTVALTVNLSWLAFSSRFLCEINPGTDAKAQIKYVLSHPFHYIMTLYKTFSTNADWDIKTAIGSRLSVFNININEAVVWSYFLLIIFVAIIYSKSDAKLMLRDKCILGIVCGIVVILIATSLYVQWTPVKNSIIEGIQGRYYLPIMGGLFLLFSNDCFDLKIKQNKSLFFYSYIGYVSAFTIISYISQMI